MAASYFLVFLLCIITINTSTSLVCKENATRNGAFLYNATRSLQTLSEESCILYNNSAALGSVDLAGGNVGIICHRPSTSHTLTWYHPNDSMVIADRNYRIYAGSEDAIGDEISRNQKFTREYDGIYTCVVTEDGTNFTETLFVGIYLEYPQLSVTLTINASLSDINARLILNCSSSGLPATTVSWFFENQLVTVGEQTQLITNKRHTVYQSLLTIQKHEVISGHLQENGEYTCQVDSGGVTSVNASKTFKIIPGTLQPPTVTNHVISWNTTPDELAVQKYELGFQGGHCNSPVLVSVNTTRPEPDVMYIAVSEELRLNKGANYTVRIRAANSFANGVWSEAVQLQTQRSNPTGPPENVNAIPMTTSMLVTWTEVNCSERNGIITEYRVTYVAQAAGSVEEHLDVAELKANLTGLRPGVQYLVSVAAVNEAGTGPPCSLNVTTGNIEKGPDQVIYIVCGIMVGMLVLSVLLVCCCLAAHRLHSKKTMPTVIDQQLNSVLEFEEEKETITATYQPVIYDFPSDVEACEGEYVLLYVTVSGNPAPILTWYHNNESINTDPSIEIGGDGTLSIPSMEEKHVGIYRLVASNCYGSCYEEVKLALEDEDTFTLRRAESIASMVDNSPVPVSSFEEYVSLHHRKNNEAFHFQFLCLNSHMDLPTTVGGTAENRIFNRFKNILPYDENRVILNPVSGSNDCQNDYINASYIDGHTPCKFIATQGPLPHTMVDFWRLVWQESTSTIVMLCNIVESHRVKCQQYWPETGSHNYGPIRVQKLHEVKVVGYVIRKFEVSMATGPSLKVTHYQFKSWPDHSVPEYGGELVSLIKRIGAPDSVTDGAILVHCSAGVGRTGVFIALDTALCQAKEEGRVDVIGIINNMRYQRMKMVQTLAQFVFIHDAILEFLVCGNTQIAVTDFRLTWNRLSRINKETGRTDLESQYRVLKKITPKASEVDTKVAEKHRPLNRSMDYLPRDQRRVILDRTESGHDYIHASFIDGYKQKKAFIIAQGPMESTCSDFWQMMYQFQCGTIVMLSDLTEYKQEACFQYWPRAREGGLNYGPYSVEFVSENKPVKDVVTRKFNLTGNKGQEPQEVTQFQVQNWTPDGLCADYSCIADLIQNVTLVQRQTGNKPIVVHCSDTVSRSAIFCAAMSAIERFKADNVVDIYQVVKTIRLQKTSAIMSVEQYAAIFSIVLAYSDGMDDKYDNFKPCKEVKNSPEDTAGKGETCPPTELVAAPKIG